VGSAPEFLDLIYLIEPVSDHVAKFQNDRSRHLGENLAKKNITGKIEDLPYYRTGGLNMPVRPTPPCWKHLSQRVYRLDTSRQHRLVVILSAMWNTSMFTVTACDSSMFYKIKPNTHRRRRRDATVELRRASAV